MSDFQKIWDGFLTTAKYWVIAVLVFGAVGISNSDWLFLSKMGQWLGLTARSIPQTELGKNLGFTEAKPLTPDE